MNDLNFHDDVRLLIDMFYEKVNHDALLAPVFSHLDWQHHLPIMYDFWSSMLFGDQTYQGNPFQKHINLPIQAEHFNRWLELFTETVDENFTGEKAEEVKARAQSIARVFQFKMGLLK